MSRISVRDLWIVLWAKIINFAKHGFASTGNWQNEGGGWQNMANNNVILPKMEMSIPE